MLLGEELEKLWNYPFRKWFLRNWGQIPTTRLDNTEDWEITARS